MTGHGEIVVAYDKSHGERGEGGVIGAQNTLPWHLRGDFDHVKALTLGRAIVMGALTWDSLPRKPLPDRLNIVLSRTRDQESGMCIARTMREALELAQAYNPEPTMIFGGAQVYREALPYVDRIHATEVDVIVENGDARFPIDPSNHPDWVEESRSEIFPLSERDEHAYRFLTFIRRDLIDE